MTDTGVTADQLLSAVATAVVKLSRTEVPGDPVYDQVTQRAYNHLVLRTSLATGYVVPRSVPHMVALIAGVPAREWLPGSDSGAVLLDNVSMHPTQECLELIVDYRDPLGEKFEHAILDAAFTACREAKSPNSYVAFRRLLIRRPTMTQLEMLEAFGDDLFLQPCMDVLRSCYRPAPAGLQSKGVFAECDGCGCLLTPVTGRGWVCDLDRCRGRKSAKIRRELEAGANGGVYHLEYPLRAFVTGPGLSEVDLEDRLIASGVKVEMWPNFDACDLLVILPNGLRWAVDVKDYANGAVLGRRFTTFKTNPGFDEAFLVVPDYRFTGGGYAESFTYARKIRHPNLPFLEPVPVSSFVKKVDTTMSGIRAAAAGKDHASA
ncbi:restriction endonuclease-related protein [Glycomyces sp. MUSA5-2]|uniref:restriction endonuclease-related protein n=1 Tax=Glycomyces sp. MUSA5-2 TaxID=2053002 RepID=UPI0030080A98